MMLNNFKRRILRNNSTRQFLFILGVVTCLIIFCVNQFFKIKHLQRNIETNYDEDEMEFSKQVKHSYPDYRIFQSAEAAEFPTVPSGVPRIPHIIHQICDSEEVLDLFVDPMRSFVEHNPKWEYRFWTYRSGRNFLEKNYPSLVKVYDNFGKNNVRKSDLLRYALIYEYGGVYADLDVMNFRSLDIATSKYACIVPTEPFEHSAIIFKAEAILTSAILLCRPKHPFFQQVLFNLQIRDTTAPVVMATGPYYLTEIYMLYNKLNMVNVRETKTDNSSNSPYFYKGTRLEVDDDAVYIPNSQYFMDSVDNVLLGSDGSLARCNHKIGTKLTQRELELYYRACNEFESRKLLRKGRKFTFTQHFWFHMWTMAKEDLKWYKKTHIKDIIPNRVAFSE